MEMSTAGMDEGSRDELREAVERVRGLKLQLNMTRGQPSPAQLDLSNGLITSLAAGDFLSRDGLDCRNYPGGVLGLPEARELFAKMLEVEPEMMLVGNSSSLELMHLVMTWAMLKGMPESQEPWSRQQAKFICPVPGYDRHFTVCQILGIEMVTVPMTDEGPDMEAVSQLAASDPSIKGIWCVPRYSNPTGITYSDAVVDALATMKTAAPDFRIFYDNAYAVHHLTDDPQPLKDIFAACRKANTENRVIMFGSTSKITFAGSGIGFLACSRANLAHLEKLIGTQTIGPNKMNQLRHVRFIDSLEGGLATLMKQHAAILKPKFDAALQVLERELGGSTLATWSKPDGGYFISLDTRPGQASKVVKMAAELGVTLTPAGATYPYGKDPEDSNIRIAPSRPSVSEVTQAMEVLSLCIKATAAAA